MVTGNNVNSKTCIISNEENLYQLQKAYLEDGNLVFEKNDGFDMALRDGFFLIRIPENLDLSSADRFAKNFYRTKENTDEPDDRYRGYYALSPEIFSDPLLGFHKRKYQIEQFLLERRFWSQYYPSELTEVGEILCQFSSDIIKNVLKKVGIPEKYWDKATGGCAYSIGSYHFTFNHFRPEMDTLGLQEHQDDGFITILRSIESGLEIYKDNKWLKLSAEPDYFKINFGLTMEILTKNADLPVSAVLHRVIQQKQNSSQTHRWSWGHFSSCQFGTDYDRGIYSYDKSIGLQFYSDARDHINKNDSYIYR
jgi:isopenicillin N synthase-like dioxygenase